VNVVVCRNWLAGLLDVIVTGKSSVRMRIKNTRKPGQSEVMVSERRNGFEMADFTMVAGGVLVLVAHLSWPYTSVK